MRLSFQKRVNRIISELRVKNCKIVIWEIDKENRDAINIFRTSGLEPDAILSFGAGHLLKKAWGINVFHPEPYIWINRDKMILCISRYEYNIHKNFLLYHLKLDRKRIFVDYKKNYGLFIKVYYAWIRIYKRIFHIKDQFKYIFSIIVSLYKLWDGFLIYKRLCRNLQEKAFVCFFHNLNIGETYLSSLLLKRYLKDENIKNCVVLLDGEKQKEVIELFDFEQMLVISPKEAEKLSRFVSNAGEEKLGIKIIGCPKSYLNTSIKLVTGKLKCLDYYIYKVFGYEEKPQLEYPVFYKDFNYPNPDLIERLGLIKGKTIFISPYSELEISAGYSFWKRIVQYYLKKGYIIITLKYGEEAPLPYTKSFDIPLKYLNVCVEYAGYFIGVRNGICDLLINAKCKKVFFYFENIYGSHYQPYKEAMSYINMATTYSWASIMDNELSDSVLEIRNQYHFNFKIIEMINNYFRGK